MGGSTVFVHPFLEIFGNLCTVITRTAKKWNSLTVYEVLELYGTLRLLSCITEGGNGTKMKMHQS